MPLPPVGGRGITVRPPRRPSKEILIHLCRSVKGARPGRIGLFPFPTPTARVIAFILRRGGWDGNGGGVHRRPPWGLRHSPNLPSSADGAGPRGVRLILSRFGESA
jgi:hypothetical protein